MVIGGSWTCFGLSSLFEAAFFLVSRNLFGIPARFCAPIATLLIGALTSLRLHTERAGKNVACQRLAGGRKPSIRITTRRLHNWPLDGASHRDLRFVDLTHPRALAHCRTGGYLHRRPRQPQWDRRQRQADAVRPSAAQ